MTRNLDTNLVFRDSKVEIEIEAEKCEMRVANEMAVLYMSTLGC